jgi:hypothetical protein
MGEVLFAHTSPVYLDMAGKRVLRNGAAEALLADMEAALKAIPVKGRFDRDEQREEVLQIYRDGIRNLQRQLVEHGTR